MVIVSNATSLLTTTVVLSVALCRKQAKLRPGRRTRSPRTMKLRPSSVRAGPCGQRPHGMVCRTMKALTFANIAEHRVTIFTADCSSVRCSRMSSIGNDLRARRYMTRQHRVHPKYSLQIVVPWRGHNPTKPADGRWHHGLDVLRRHGL